MDDSATPPAPPAAPAEAYRPTHEHVRGRAWPLRLLGRFSSLRSAALLISTLAVVTGLGTYYERDFGQPATQVMIYESWWFTGLCLLLALNIFGAAAVRYPWRRRQIGFVVVHIGLLTIMLGAWLARNRLDGVLLVPPDAEAAQIDLPTDLLTIVDGVGGQERRLAVDFQPLAMGTQPSFLRYLMSAWWPLQAGGITSVDVPLCTPSADYDPGLTTTESGWSPGRWAKQRWLALKHGGRVLGPESFPTVRLTRIALTAHDDLGWGPAADGSVSAVKAVLSGRTPQMAPDANETIAQGWLSPAGQSVLEAGPASISLGRSGSPTLIEDFLAAVPPIARTLVVHHAGKRKRLAIDPTALPVSLDLGPDLVVLVERALERPRFDGTSLNESDEGPVDPMLVARIGSGPAETRNWRSLPVFAFYPAFTATAGPAGSPELVYEHPAEAGEGGTMRGVNIQVLLIPEGGFALRWISRSKGLLGCERLAPGATHWQGMVVGGEGVPMRLDLTLDLVAKAERRPEPRDMLPDQADRAARWIEIEVTRGAASGRTWLRRGGTQDGGGYANVRLSDGSDVLFAYDVARLDLAKRHGVTLRLERFDEGRDIGGGTRATYVSDVRVTPSDGRPATTQRITMNEPLVAGGVTFYQTSFVPEVGADGQLVPGRYRYSVLQAATDPGRPFKYAGSILLVGGIVLMYLLRPRRAKTA